MICFSSDAVDLSFQSYDSGSPSKSDDVPIYVMHGLLGSKSNWNFLSKSIHMKTKRKVILFHLCEWILSSCSLLTVRSQIM